MGAGRKTETYTLPPNQDLVPYNVFARHLMKNHLGAVIFGCKHSTMNECLSKQLFGLPAPHHVYVKNIVPGLPLFLFNYSERKLYGIFEATSEGQMNIDPYEWTTDGSGRTQFPAQVRIRVRLQCPPLLESQFKPIIADNYFSPHHFMFELDHVQTRMLLSLLEPLAISPGKPIPQNTMKRETDFRAIQSCSTIQEVESHKPPTSEAENLNSSSLILAPATSVPTVNWETDFPSLPTRKTIQKAQLRRPPTSEAENLNSSSLKLASTISVTAVNCETDFPALPSRNTIQKKTASCKPPTSESVHLNSSRLKLDSATSVPQKRVGMETDLPALPSRSTIEKPEWPYQLTSEVEHVNRLSPKWDSTSSTPQNTVKWEADFPDFPSLNTIQDPEWLEALISEAQHLNGSSLKLDSAALFGTYGSFQALSDVKKAEQEELHPIYTKLKELNLQHNLHSECQNMPLSGDVDSEERRAESPYSSSDQKSGESSCYFYAQSLGSVFYPWIITKLLQEVQELKAFRTAQTKKMVYLEDKLVRAELEIQQLKDLFVVGV